MEPYKQKNIPHHAYNVGVLRITLHTATKWTFRHNVMLLWFKRKLHKLKSWDSRPQLNFYVVFILNQSSMIILSH